MVEAGAGPRAAWVRVEEYRPSPAPRGRPPSIIPRNPTVIRITWTSQNKANLTHPFSIVTSIIIIVVDYIQSLKRARPTAIFLSASLSSREIFHGSTDLREIQHCLLGAGWPITNAPTLKDKETSLPHRTDKYRSDDTCRCWVRQARRSAARDVTDEYQQVTVHTRNAAKSLQVFRRMRRVTARDKSFRH